MHFWLYLCIFSLHFSYIIPSDVLTNFNITMKTPGNELPPTQTPYKSIHVRYTVPSNDDQWNIVAIEPLIQISNETIAQMVVHLCQTATNINQQNTIWYDDETNCKGAQSMLIYQWTSDLSASIFQMSDGLGFQLDKSKSIVLTVTYFKERQLHINPSGIILSISTQIPRFHVGTLLVGNKQQGNRFSCRSLNYPRLLYAVKPLFSKTSNPWWRIDVIRNRNFGRKSVQVVTDSTIFAKENQTDLKIVSPDIFLIPGDYILIECTQNSEIPCQFLIFYTFKNLPDQYFDKHEYTCENNNYPELFKLIPLTSNQVSPQVSGIDGTTIFLLVCVLFLVIWISIITGCIIMRRIRGLVNYRTEPSSPRSAQNTQPFFATRGTVSDQNQQRMVADGDRTAQLDIEHMGLMS